MKQWMVFTLFFLTGNVYAADLCTNCKSEDFTDFSGGLATTVPSHKLDKKFSPNMRNVFVHRNMGSVKTRNGFISVGSTNTLQDGRFGFTYYKEDGSVEFIVSDSSVVLSTKDFITYTFISSGLTATAGLDCAQVRQKAVCTNGADAPFSWNGSTKTSLTWMPKGKYIEYWQNRMWVLNSTGDATSLDFSDTIISTSGEIIAPDDPRAFPASNRIYMGRGSGQSGTGLWIQNSRLFVGMDRSIWRVLGNDSSSYVGDIVDPQVGVISNDSISLLDGLVYFKGLDGIYEFNGQKARRITDGIVPDMNSVNNSVSNILSNTWDSQNDFSKGLLGYGSTATATGFLTLFDNGVQANIGNNAEPVPDGSQQKPYPYFFSTTTTWVNRMVLSSTVTFSSDFVGFIGTMTFWTKTDPCCPCGAGNTRLNIYIENSRTGKNQVILTGASTTDGSFSKQAIGDFTQSVEFTGSDINNGNFVLQVESASIGGCASHSFWFYPSTGIGYSTLDIRSPSAVQFISDTAALTSITNWDTFNSVINTNNGSIDFFIRSATSPSVNLSTVIWTSISPGKTIDLPISNNYFQWATTITAVLVNPNYIYPNIDTVKVNHNEGGISKNRPFATQWNKEYWLSIATGTNNTSIQYVKAWYTNENPDAWNRFYGQDIRSFFKDGNSTLYAGSASTGTFYRLDYGINDNGKAIDSYWETPDMIHGDNFHDKKLFELWVDADKVAGSNFTVGISTNNGTMVFYNFAMSGTDRTVKNIRNVSSFGNTFRFRLGNSELDKGFTLHNFSVIYEPLAVFSSR